LTDEFEGPSVSRHLRKDPLTRLHRGSATVGELAANYTMFITTLRNLGASTMVQRVGLGPGATAVDIDMTVNWNESEKLLKLAFPLDVHAERVAAETQYGHVFRATHVKTSWDAARFEVCRHRWLHLGEPGFGVAIAIDSTYGYDVERSVREDGETVTTGGAPLADAEGVALTPRPFQFRTCGSRGLGRGTSHPCSGQDPRVTTTKHSAPGDAARIDDTTVFGPGGEGRFGRESRPK
jgi:hypothetical protein